MINYNLPVNNGFPNSVLTSGNAGNLSWAELIENKKMKEVCERLDAIEKRLLIVRPDEALMEKYPALKEAYDAYQLIAKIVDQDARA